MDIINEILLKYASLNQLVNTIILGITALFIILYWKETQRMKYQMIEQNKLTNKQIKSSNMPILDAMIEQVKPSPEMAHLQMQFAYDIFLLNKGSGPAFNISIQRYPSEGRTQKEAIHDSPNSQIEHFQNKINIIGKDEKVLVHREHSNSYRSYTLKVRFFDIFIDHYEWEFEGDRDGLALKKYEILRSEDKLSLE